MALRDIKAARRRSQRGSGPLHEIKLRAIDAAFQRQPVTSFADLGGVWAVDGGYTFYALEKYSPGKATLVDEEFTEKVRRRAREFSALELLSENFGNAAVPSTLGKVDAVFLFDVLLHQVAPDWDAILRLYAPITECFVIVNPQYVDAERTVRLIDLGEQRYHELVPAQPGYEDVFSRLDEFIPDRGRSYRDIHNIWQWGIVDDDLALVMRELGFELIYYENAGQWREQPSFENHSFCFKKSSSSPRGLPL